MNYFMAGFIAGFLRAKESRGDEGWDLDDAVVAFFEYDEEIRRTFKTPEGSNELQ